MDFGYELQPWAFGVHCACAGVALACLPFAVYYGALIKHRLMFMTPVLCIALGYENLLLVLPSRYATIGAQRFGWIMNAIIPPLFLTTCFETGYVVHKHRSVKYLGINFDEGKRVPTQPCSWLLRNLVRLIALALLLMGLVVNFSGFFDDSSDNAGMSGFLGLAKQDKAHFYVSLVPAIIFSAVSILIGATIAKYGIHSTLLIRRSLGWYYMLVGALVQCAGQFPAQTDVYPATSMLGQTVFLLCIVLAHRIVLRDLLEAARITEFLRRQKAVQIQLAATSVLREGGLKATSRSGFPPGTVSLPVSLASTPLAGSAANSGIAVAVGGGGGDGPFGWQRRPSQSSPSLPPMGGHGPGHGRHHHHHHQSHYQPQQQPPQRQPSMQGISSSGGKGAAVPVPPEPPLGGNGVSKGANGTARVEGRITPTTSSGTSGGAASSLASGARIRGERDEEMGLPTLSL